jgi:hypothetical protein
VHTETAETLRLKPTMPAGLIAVLALALGLAGSLRMPRYGMYGYMPTPKMPGAGAVIRQAN